MSSETKFDLTQGPILNKLLFVAIPIMGTQLMQMAYNLANMFWMGKVGSDAVASIGTAGMFLWLSSAFLLLGRMGSEIGVSQNLGRGDIESAKRYSQSAVLLAAFFGILCAFIMTIFSKELISVFNIREANVYGDAVRYLSIVALGSPFLFISSAITGTFNGSGNSRLSFIAHSIGLVVNMVLDPLLIFTFDLGISGAGYATIISQAIVCMVFVLLVKFGKSRPFPTYKFLTKPDFMKIGQILKWSTPISLESFLFTVLAMFNTRFVSAFGANALAVMQVGTQIESLSWLIGGGFGSAITAFVGQNFGAFKWDRIRSCFKVSTLSMSVWGLFTTLLLLFFGRFLFSLFLQEPEILQMGQRYLQILAFCQVFMCMESVASGFFRGIGETIPPSITSISGNALRVPFAFFLSQTSLGLDGIWIAVTAGAILRGICIMSWYLIRARKFPKEIKSV